MGLNLSTIIRDPARRAPDERALVTQGRILSRGDLDEGARRFASGLAALGVRRGQHVALMLPNIPEFTLVYFGSHYLGAPVVPLNVMLTAEEIAYHLSDSDAVAVIVWEGFLEQARAGIERSETCRTLIVVGRGESASAGEVNVSRVLNHPEPVTELPDTSPDETAVILYTSGTTGRPKGAELTHFNLFYNADVASSRLMHFDERTVALGVLPLFHSFGQTVIQNAVLMAGGRIVLLPRFDPAAVLETMSAHGVTFFAGVPTMYFALLHHENVSAYDLSALRTCVSGGAAMPVDVMTAFDTRYGVSILEGYGLSETSPVASFNVLDRPKKPGSIGIPIPGVEFKLVDDDGETIDGPDRPGEICVKGHNVMKGYHKRREATAESIRDGWFHTGDIAQRDEEGYYFIVDRKKDMIVRGGFNVYPREVEEVLYAHPAVAEAAVIGVPDERSGEEVKAIIVRKKGRTDSAEEIIDYCRERLAAYKYPRLVDFLDALPKGPTGKILKRRLRETD